MRKVVSARLQTIYHVTDIGQLDTNLVVSSLTGGPRTIVIEKMEWDREGGMLNVFLRKDNVRKEAGIPTANVAGLTFAPEDKPSVGASER